jgi:hypothetical protein
MRLLRRRRWPASKDSISKTSVGDSGARFAASAGCDRVDDDAAGEGDRFGTQRCIDDETARGRSSSAGDGGRDDRMEGVREWAIVGDDRGIDVGETRGGDGDGGLGDDDAGGGGGGCWPSAAADVALGGRNDDDDDGEDVLDDDGGASARPDGRGIVQEVGGEGPLMLDNQKIPRGLGWVGGGREDPRDRLSWGIRD